MGPFAQTATLTVASLAAGVAMLWAFGRFSNQRKIGRAKHRLRAHLYELTLFSSDPVLMWRAQRRLLAWNLRYLGLMLRPAVVVALPMALLLVQLDAIYGRRPLAPGETAILTAGIDPSVDLREVSPSLEAPAGAIEASPAVRLPGEHEVCWRLKALRGASVGIELDGRVYRKRIAAGAPPLYLPARSVASRAEQLLYPGEALLPAGAVKWIEVEYPEGGIPLFGWRIHWLVWFCVVSLGAALLLRKRMGIEF